MHDCKAKDVLEFKIDAPPSLLPYVSCNSVSVEIEYYNNLDAVVTERLITELEKKALTNFEIENNMHKGTASLWQVENHNSSIEEWSKWFDKKRDEEDLSNKGTDFLNDEDENIGDTTIDLQKTYSEWGLMRDEDPSILTNTQI